MKNDKRSKINLLFSSFLVIGFIVCSYFFSTLALSVDGGIGALIQVLILVLFGLLLFYATRVGEGAPIKRFSLAVLLLVDLPTLYIILATFIEGLPLHDALSSVSVVFMLAGVALGYAIPYTFLSGFELAAEEDDAPAEEEKPVEGGIAEELAALEEVEEVKELAEEAEEEIVEEIAEEAAEELTEAAK